MSCLCFLLDCASFFVIFLCDIISFVMVLQLFKLYSLLVAPSLYFSFAMLLHVACSIVRFSCGFFSNFIKVFLSIFISYFMFLELFNLYSLLGVPSYI